MRERRSNWLPAKHSLSLIRTSSTCMPPYTHSEDMRTSTWKPCPPVGLELAPPAGPVYPQWGYENIHLKTMSTSLIRTSSTLQAPYTHSEDMRTSTWKPCPPVWLDPATPAGPVYPQWGYENIHLKTMSTSLIRPSYTCRPRIPTVRIWEHPLENHVHQSD